MDTAQIGAFALAMSIIVGIGLVYLERKINRHIDSLHQRIQRLESGRD